MKCKNCGYESPIRTHASGQGIPTSVSGEKGGFKRVGTAYECPKCGFKNQK